MTIPGDLAKREASIRALISAGEQDKAKTALFDLIVACAQDGDLDNANRLRDLLYEVDPMALKDIIRANELIEETLNGAVSDAFNRAWANLRELLTAEEFVALYHALAEHRIEADKPVVKAGSRFDALFLVTNGNISVTCSCGGKIVELAALEPGAAVEGNCFSPSVWTYSLTCLSPVTLHVLRRQQFVALLEKHPGLEVKLHSLCRPFDTIWQQLREKEAERRAFRRIQAHHRVTFQLLKEDDSRDNRLFRGELINIGRSGLAFILRIGKRKNRQALFGRRLSVTVDPEGRKAVFIGTVVAVSAYDLQNHDYAVHVHFADPVGSAVLQPLLPPVPEEEQTGDSDDDSPQPAP